jgi:hypothetical protein
MTLLVGEWNVRNTNYNGNYYYIYKYNYNAA